MTQSLKVLVADDNQVNRMVAIALLRKAGHQVTAVENGQDAVVAASGGGFDVVLMDIRMPGMDGAEAARAIRALPEAANAAVPIIALTASPFEDELEACRQAGMNGCLFKPFNITLFAVAYGEVQAGAPWRVQGQGEPGSVVDPAHLADLAHDLPPELFAASLDACRRSMRQSLDELGLAADRRDRAMVGNIAHKLRGTAGTYGFRALHILAGDVEVQARDSSAPPIEAAATRLHEQVCSCLKVLDGILAAGGRPTPYAATQ